MECNKKSTAQDWSAIHLDSCPNGRYPGLPSTKNSGGSLSAAESKSLARGPETDRQARTEAIVQAAIGLMSERGYAGTSLQDVADRVGVLKGNLYYYFRSKEDLLLRILEDTHEESARRASEVHALGLKPSAELFEILRTSSVWYLENVERANIYFTESRQLSGTRRSAIITLQKVEESRLNSLIEQGQAVGELTTDYDATFLTTYVIGAINSVRTWRHGIEEISHRDAGDRFIDLLRRTLSPR